MDRHVCWWAKILRLAMLLLGTAGTCVGQGALRIGLQASPEMSWLRSGDDMIQPDGGNPGLKLGVIGELGIRESFSFVFGVHLAFHEGGTLLYETGGNYLPNSDLSDQLLQTGDKPLPDGTTIRYNLQYLAAPVGLRLKSGDNKNVRFFLDAPVLTASFLTRGRGDIDTGEERYEGENIYKDLAPFNLFIGAGGGIEYFVSRSNAIQLGLFYDRGLLDMTKDDGYTSIGHPLKKPPFERIPEDSQTIIQTLTLRIGFLF